MNRSQAECLDNIENTWLVERAIGWCQINSFSGNTGGLMALHAVLGNELAQLPGECEALDLEPLAEIAADGTQRTMPLGQALRLTVRPDAERQILLTGHYDTVYPTHHPMKTREDGALLGPGIADMKGGLSVMLGALAAFERYPDAGRVGYTVLISPDEEIGSPGSAPLLAHAAKTAHIGMTYEPCLPDGALAAARKGSGNFHLLLKGQAAHAGRDFAAGRNALAGAATIAAQLHALNGARAGVTINIARIDGGGALNVVPDIAVLRFNIRVPDAAAQSWAEVLLAGLHVPGLECSLHGAFTRPAKPVNAAQTALMKAVADAGHALGQPIAWRDSGGVCEGNNLFAAGLPNIDTLGVRGGAIHSQDEFAWPDSFAEKARLSALILMRIASGEIDAPAIRAAMPA